MSQASSSYSTQSRINLTVSVGLLLFNWAIVFPRIPGGEYKLGYFLWSLFLLSPVLILMFATGLLAGSTSKKASPAYHLLWGTLCLLLLHSVVVDNFRIALRFGQKYHDWSFLILLCALVILLPVELFFAVTSPKRQ